MPIVDGDYLRVTADLLDPRGNHVMNVWHFQVTGVASPTDANVVSAAEAEILQLYALFDEDIVSGYSDNLILIDKVDWVIDHWETIYTLSNDAWPPGYTPGAVADELPPGVSSMITLGTLLRKHSGRKYFSGYGEGANTAAGLILAAVMSDMANVAAEILTPRAIPVDGGSLIHVVPNYKGTVMNHVVFTVMNNIWRSQRRRQPGVGI